MIYDNLLKGLSPDINRGDSAPHGMRLNLARVTSIDYLAGEDGNITLDALGNKIPTGLLNIELVDHSGSPEKVPYLFPMVGNSMMIGGLPEVGSFCVVGYRQGMRPVILGFLPMGLHRLIMNRKSVKNLFPGEFILQSSTTVDTEEIGSQVFAGAAIKWDIYGRLIVKTQGYECVYGGALANEYTEAIAALEDPVTKQRIWIREVVSDGAWDKRFDVQGNLLVRSLRSAYGFFKGVVHLEVASQLEVVVERGMTLVNGLGSGFFITEEGVPRIFSSKGAVELESAGNINETVGAHKSVIVNGNMSEMVGSGSRNEVVAVDKTESVGGKYTTNIVGEAREEFEDSYYKKTSKDWIEKCDQVRSIDAETRVEIGGPDAADFLLRGTTYRNNETELNGKYKEGWDGVKDLSEKVQGLAQSLLTVIPMLITAHTVTAAAAPISSAANSAAASSLGSAISSVVQLLTTSIQTGIKAGQASSQEQTFESKAADYLSPKHKVY